ncbi:hypothetical protein BH20ACT3_BH20ACT3_11370 [soil metagenome]
MLDVVALVALNVLTGTFSLVAGLEPDPPSPTPLVAASPGPTTTPKETTP